MKQLNTHLWGLPCNKSLVRLAFEDFLYLREVDLGPGCKVTAAYHRVYD